MNMTKNNNIRLSIICVWIFAALLLAADILAFIWVPAYVSWRQMEQRTTALMIITLYAASICGWMCLWALRKLLKNISADLIFICENVKMLGIIARCCAAASLIFFISSVYYGPFLIVAAAAVFMTLIVRIVRNVFQRANAMKDELDLTI